MHNDTTLLLGLADVVVDRVELDPDGTRVIHMTTANTPQACPSCAPPATSVKGRVTTQPRDLPFPVATRLLWRKRRWRCQHPARARSSVAESAPQIPARPRVTSRLRAAAGRAVALAGRAVAQAAADTGLSWPTVNAAFPDHATATLPGQPHPVAAWGIDETRRGTPRFVLDADTGVFEQITTRWHTGVVDLTGAQGLLGQGEGRSAGDAGSWLAAQTQQWREGVTTVAIDMSSAYRAAVREHLPRARLVVDHFHVAQLANQVVSQFGAPEGHRDVAGPSVRKDDPEYGVRRRLLRDREGLTPEKFADRWNRLIDLGPAGDQILAAWIAKEELRALLALARAAPSRHQISHRLWLFYRWCADTDIPELRRLAASIEAWWPQIEAFILTGVTNAASEGVNRLIKLEARNAFGFRNPVNQRLRSRCASVRAAWRRDEPG